MSVEGNLRFFPLSSPSSVINPHLNKCTHCFLPVTSSPILPHLTFTNWPKTVGSCLNKPQGRSAPHHIYRHDQHLLTFAEADIFVPSHLTFPSRGIIESENNLRIVAFSDYIQQ